MKIEFEKTNIIRCVFSLRQNNNAAGPSAVYDEFDRREGTKSLKSYMYRVLPDLEGHVFVGDFVVVHCATGFQICEVVEIDVQRSEWANPAKLAPVVCKVDMVPYFAEVERAAKAARLKDLIEIKKKQLEAEMSYDYFAEKSPEFKKMLNEFRELGGQF